MNGPFLSIAVIEQEFISMTYPFFLYSVFPFFVPAEVAVRQKDPTDNRVNPSTSRGARKGLSNTRKVKDLKIER